MQNDQSDIDSKSVETPETGRQNKPARAFILASYLLCALAGFLAGSMKEGRVYEARLASYKTEQGNNSKELFDRVESLASEVKSANEKLQSLTAQTEENTNALRQVTGVAKGVFGSAKSELQKSSRTLEDAVKDTNEGNKLK